jgi:hypothetical protein
VALHAVRPLASTAAVWGLACIGGEELWTLETGHSLARLTADGVVAERIHIDIPWVALFGAGDRVIAQALPIAAGRPLLTAAAPRRLNELRPWLGPIGRGDPSAPSAYGRNLVKCGIGSGAVLPCWFADEARVVVSDGVRVRTHTISIPDHAADLAMPIWDVACAPGERLWVLATSARPADGRRAADVVALVDANGAAVARQRLLVPARLIVSADQTAVTLLLTTGELAVVRLGSAP